MIDWSKRKYTQEGFEIAWFASTSYTGVAEALGYRRTGGVLDTIRTTAIELGLPNNHILGMRIDGGGGRLDLNKILVKDSAYRGSPRDLRIRLVREGLKENRCEQCGLSEWNDRPIPLDLDHVDGDNKNNLLSNLRVLCANCHRQTVTWGIGAKRLAALLPKPRCMVCGLTLGNKRSERCPKHAAEAAGKAKKKKREWPATAEILVKVASIGYSAYGKELGVSDNAVRKHLRAAGISPLPKYR